MCRHLFFKEKFLSAHPFELRYSFRGKKYWLLTSSDDVMKCSSILLGCLITGYEFFAYTESPPESPVALLSRVPRAASERIKLCWSMVKKKERSGWRESTSRRALFSLPLISGYPRSGFPQGKGGGGFRPRSSPPRRFLIKGNSPRFSSKLKLFPSLFLWTFKPRNVFIHTRQKRRLSDYKIVLST